MNIFTITAVVLIFAILAGVPDDAYGHGGHVPCDDIGALAAHGYFHKKDPDNPRKCNAQQKPPPFMNRRDLAGVAWERGAIAGPGGSAGSRR